tara:strand:- start:108 stop:770 length:663 start_codon:yes stop_codon:yes gene_type:complete
MIGKAAILASHEIAEKIIGFAPNNANGWEFARVDTLQGVSELFRADDYDLLISYGTSVIVPKWIIEKPTLSSVNLHAASPKYPGRDPHHFAVYEGATTYGATLHYMAATVDSGPIIDVDLFGVLKDSKPVDLLYNANESALKLLEKYIPQFLNGNIPEPNMQFKWEGKKRSRKDFLDLCEIRPGISEAEFQRRLQACQMEGYENLFTEIRGHRFTYKSKS